MNRLTKNLLWASFSLWISCSTIHAGPYPGGTQPHTHQNINSGGVLANPGVTQLHVASTITAPTAQFGNLTASGTISFVGTFSTTNSISVGNLSVSSSIITPDLTVTNVLLSSSTTNIKPNLNLLFNGDFSLWSSTGPHLQASSTTTSGVLMGWRIFSNSSSPGFQYYASTITTDSSGVYSLNMRPTIATLGTPFDFYAEQIIPNPQKYRGKKVSLVVRGGLYSWVLAAQAPKIFMTDNFTSTSAIMNITNSSSTMDTYQLTMNVNSAADFLTVRLGLHASQVSNADINNFWHFASAMLVIGEPTNFQNTDSFVSDPNNQNFYPISISSNGVSILGTSNNNTPCTGCYGEYVSSSVTNSTLAPTSNQYGDLASITLTAGDWDISISARWNSAGATWSDGFFGISSTSGNSGSGLTPENSQDWNFASSATTPLSINVGIPNYRVSITSPATYYLKYFSLYTVGQPVARGRISARRAR